MTKHACPGCEQPMRLVRDSYEMVVHEDGGRHVPLHPDSPKRTPECCAADPGVLHGYQEWTCADCQRGEHIDKGPL